MNLDELVQAVRDYMDVKERKGDLSNVSASKISSFNLPLSYASAACSPEAKEEFDEAKQKLETVLNNYIDDRVKAVIESMKRDA